jgi:viroplasmin and RNaseH domain-containing protein
MGGPSPGIYEGWLETYPNVNKKPGATNKGFPNLESATAYWKVYTGQQQCPAQRTQPHSHEPEVDESGIRMIHRRMAKEALDNRYDDMDGEDVADPHMEIDISESFETRTMEGINHQYGQLKAAAPLSDYYAVWEGKELGMYSTWEECRAEIENHPNSNYQRFDDTLVAHDILRTMAQMEWSMSNEISSARRNDAQSTAEPNRLTHLQHAAKAAAAAAIAAKTAATAAAAKEYTLCAHGGTITWYIRGISCPGISATPSQYIARTKIHDDVPAMNTRLATQQRLDEDVKRLKARKSATPKKKADTVKKGKTTDRKQSLKSPSKGISRSNAAIWSTRHHKSRHHKLKRS